MTTQPRLTGGLLGVLAFLAAVGPFATDMYLASFTGIGRDLGVSASSVQLTLTAFLLGMGVGQLCIGTLSDQFGRRRILLAALILFTASSIALVFVPNITLFIAFRAVQGFSGAGGIVIARAIAVDLSQGAAAIRALSLIAMLTGLGPLIAPPIGGAIESVADWRMVLATIAAISVAMLVLAVLFVPESLPPAARNSTGIRPALRSFAALLRDSRFTAMLVIFSLAFGSIMAYVSASPFVGQVVLDMSPFVYSLGFGIGALGLLLGNAANARLAGRSSPLRMIVIGAALMATAGAALTVTAALDVLSAPLFITAAFVLSCGTALVMPNTSALALLRAPASRGSGSALLGAAQFAVGGIASPVVGAWGEHTALPMAIFIVAAALLTLVGAMLFARRGHSGPTS